MTVKYVPVLQYRGAEISAIESFSGLRVSKPLIELVKDSPDGSYRTTLSKYNFDLFVDVPMHIKISQSTLEDVEQFLSLPIVNINERLNIFQQIGYLPHITPVISYNPNTNFSAGVLNTQRQFLAKLGYDKFAYRLYNAAFDAPFIEIAKIIGKDDTLIFDLDYKSLSTEGTKCTAINALKTKVGFFSVPIQSMIPKSLKNKDYVHKGIETNIDTSIVKDSKTKGFDAFGDYCGIKKNDLKKARGISPAFLFYSFKNNHFIGFRGTQDKMPTFKTIIAPAILSNPVWNEYSQALINSCPGRQYILTINANQGTGNQTTWKTAGIAHYLSTMDSLL